MPFGISVKGEPRRTAPPCPTSPPLSSLPPFTEKAVRLHERLHDKYILVQVTICELVVVRIGRWIGNTLVISIRYE